MSNHQNKEITEKTPNKKNLISLFFLIIKEEPIKSTAIKYKSDLGEKLEDRS